ncbi:MAG: DUF4907 domain-containing protein [Bacteroidota bacterium]
MIKRHNTIVILAAVAMSAGVWIYSYSSSTTKKEKITAKFFEGLNGWGYDILVNNVLFIHQESIPVLPGKKGFLKKEQAEQTALLIINKMKRGQPPTITTFEMKQLFSLHDTQYDQPGKAQ